MIKFTLRNLISFLKADKLIAILVVLCVAASCIIMQFAYGVYQNYHVVLTQNESGVSLLEISITKPDAINKASLLKCLYSLPDDVLNAIGSITALADVQPECRDIDKNPIRNIPLTCQFTIEQGEITNSKQAEYNINKSGLLKGKYFSNDNQQRGSCVAVLRADSDFTAKDRTLKWQLVHTDSHNEEYVILQGKKYQVIGYAQNVVPLEVPIMSLDDDTYFIRAVAFSFDDGKTNNYITRYQYNKIQEAFLSNFNDAVSIPDLDIPDTESRYLYRTVLLITFLITILAALNFAQLYRYIFDKRKRKHAIFRLCGCTLLNASFMLLFESLCLMVPVYIISVLLYSNAILPLMTNYYPYIEGAYSTKIYFVLFFIYFIVSAAILFLMIVRLLLKSHIVGDMQGGRK